MKKQNKPRVLKGGIKNAPIDSFEVFLRYFREEASKSEISKIAKSFLTRRKLPNIPDTEFQSRPHVVAAIYWSEDLKKEFEPRTVKRQVWVNDKKHFVEDTHFYDGKKTISNFLTEMSRHFSSKTTKQPATVQTKTNPILLLKAKTNRIVFDFLDNAFSNIFDGNPIETTNASEFMTAHDLPPKSIPFIIEQTKKWQNQYEDARNGKCPQAKEAFGHIPKKQLKIAIDFCNNLISQFETKKVASKNIRKARTPKKISSTKLVEKMSYLDKFDDLNIASISPESIVGAKVLLCYNTKNKKLLKFEAESNCTLSVKGSTLLFFDKEKSTEQTLRKPESVLPQFLAGTLAKTKKDINALTTKKAVPTGRINNNTILLRVYK